MNPQRFRRELLEKYNYACHFCGAKDVPLEIAYKLALSKGGVVELENLLLLCPNCHRRYDQFQPNEMEFVLFLQELMLAHPNYSDPVLDARLGESSFRPDFQVVRKLGKKNISLVIEAKRQSFLRSVHIDSVIKQLKSYKSMGSFDAAAIAFLGKISDKDRIRFETEQIEVWSLDFVAKEFEKEIELSSKLKFKSLYSVFNDPDNLSKPNRLQKRLSECKSGKEHWGLYQKLIRDIFDYLFTPPLAPAYWESADAIKVNRRDLIYPNYASKGFWKFLRDRYMADCIVIDPKNYKDKIRKPQVLQIANYLKPHGTGMFAIITTRTGCDKGSVATLREQWAVYNKLIIVLTDDDLEKMISAKSSKGPPEEVLSQVIQEFRLSM